MIFLPAISLLFAVVHSSTIIKSIDELYETDTFMNSTTYLEFKESAIEPFFHPTNKTYASINGKSKECIKPTDYQLGELKSIILFPQFKKDAMCLYRFIGVGNSSFVNEGELGSKAFANLTSLYAAQSLAYGINYEKLELLSQDIDNDAKVTINDPSIRITNDNSRTIFLDVPTREIWTSSFAVDWTCKNMNCTLAKVAPSFAHLQDGLVDIGIKMSLVAMTRTDMSIKILATRPSDADYNVAFDDHSVNTNDFVYMVCNQYGFCRTMAWDVVEGGTPENPTVNERTMTILLGVLGGICGSILIGFGVAYLIKRRKLKEEVDQ